MVALGAGVRLDVVSRQLGHANIATTGNIYTHDSDEAGNEGVATAFLAHPRSESS
jgi:integrase